MWSDYWQLWADCRGKELTQVTPGDAATGQDPFCAVMSGSLNLKGQFTQTCSDIRLFDEKWIEFGVQCSHHWNMFHVCLMTLSFLNQCPCYSGCSTHRRNTDFIGIICSLESTSNRNSKICGLCKAVVPNMGAHLWPPQGKPNKSEQPAMVIKVVTYFLNKFRLILFFISFHFFLWNTG